MFLSHNTRPLLGTRCQQNVSVPVFPLRNDKGGYFKTGWKLVSSAECGGSDSPRPFAGPLYQTQRQIWVSTHPIPIPGRTLQLPHGIPFHIRTKDSKNVESTARDIVKNRPNYFDICWFSQFLGQHINLVIMGSGCKKRIIPPSNSNSYNHRHQATRQMFPLTEAHKWHLVNILTLGSNEKIWLVSLCQQKGNVLPL